MLALAVALAGCAHRERMDRAESIRRTRASEPPPFLNGPCALLLTNSEGYASHVDFWRGADKKEALAGELMVRGAKLFFAIESDGSKGKHSRGGTVSYVWDASADTGLVISDALQGYAPIHSTLRFTNLTVLNPAGSGGTPKPAEVRPDSGEQVSVASSDGSLATFAVWRSANPGLPSRITSLSGGSLYTLELTKTQRLEPALSMFEPPPGFTKYDSADNMMYEILARQQNVRRRSDEPREPVDLEDTRGPIGARRY